MNNLAKNKLMIKPLFILVTLSIYLVSCKSDDDSLPEQEPINYEYTQEEKDEEINRLKLYIGNKGYENVQETSSGLHYIIEKAGNGLYPEESFKDNVICHYEFINMETEVLIEATDRTINEYGQVLDMEYLIPGLQEGLLLVNEGAVIRLFIPSYLAYGKISYGEITPKMNIESKIELNIVLRP